MGTYQVSVDGLLGCASMMATVDLHQPEALATTTASAPASCPDSNDGLVEVTAIGGTAPYAYLWSNGAATASINTGAGIYTVLVTDANGCSVQTDALQVSSGPAPVAEAEADQYVVGVGVPVTFSSSSQADAWQWSFGDGAVSDAQVAEHSYALPGSYQVTLTVTEGACSGTTTLSIVVETATAVADAKPAQHMRAWMNGDQLVVEHGFADQYPLQLEVLNEAGQVWKQMRVAGPAGKLHVPADDLVSGVWLVRVSNDQMRKSIPVVVVR
jgi:PKD repeat protein